MNNAEGIAASVAPVLSFLARAGAPLVWLMRVSPDSVLTLLRVKQAPGSPWPEEEVKSLIPEGTPAGWSERAVKARIDRVHRLADRRARSYLVPGPAVTCLK